MKNSYPEKPLVPYKKTSVEMAAVIAAMRSIIAPAEIKRSTYIMFRNESANGQSGVNFNFCGFQADSGRWPAVHDKNIVGVVAKKENGTGKDRLFLAFKDVAGCLSMLFERVAGRGLYVGGIPHLIWKDHYIKDKNDLARAYIKEWVRGGIKEEPTTDELKNFLSMYAQAEKLFT